MKRKNFQTILFSLQAIMLVCFPATVFALVPNDPQFSERNGVATMQLTEAWDITQGSDSVIVAVIDAGVDVANPDLVDNIWLNPKEKADGIDNDGNGLIDDIRGWNFVKNTPDVRPSLASATDTNRIGLNHGTVIAGIIGAVGNNGKGGTGVNWRVKILPLKILDDKGEGDTDLAVQAIDYAIQKKASIINLSFVGPTPSLDFIQAVRRAYRAGILVIAAAGNAQEGSTGTNLDYNPQYPVCFDDPLKEENWVIGVAALADDGRLAPFSNFGSKCIDIAAPGHKIPSTVLFDPATGRNDIYGGGWSGTSIAAPFVSGVAALIKSVQPTWGPDQIRKALFETVDPVPGNSDHAAGLGSVNAYKAVRYAEQGGDGGLAQGFYIAPEKTARGVAAHVLDTEFNETKSFIVAPAGTSDVRLGTADMHASGVAQIVATASSAKGSLVRYFQRDGKLFKDVRPFGNKERGGMPLTITDVDGDGADEVMIASNKLRQVLVLEGDGKTRTTITIPEPRGSISVAAYRYSDRTIIATSIQQGKRIDVYLWDQFGTYLSDFGFELQNANPATIGFVPTIAGDGQLYVAQLQPTNLVMAYYSLDGEFIQSFVTRPTSGKLYGFVYGRVHTGDQKHLVLGVTRGNQNYFERIDSEGVVVSSEKSSANKLIKFTSLYFGQ